MFLLPGTLVKKYGTLKNPRVKIITTGTYPDGMASTYRIYCYAKALIEKGIQVEVVSAKTHVPYPGKIWNYHSIRDNVPFTLIWNRRAFSIRWLNYIWALIKSYVLLLHCVFSVKKYDILWLYGMDLISRFMLLPILHLLGKKVVLEVNEYPYSTGGNKITRIPAIRKLLQWGTTSFIIPQVDGAVVISENLRKVINYYAPELPVLKVPILVDANSLKNSNNNEPTIYSHPYLFHAGSLSVPKDGIIKVFHAYARAANKLQACGFELDFVITNSSTQAKIWTDIQHILKKHGLQSNLKITGYLENKELINHIRHASVLLINKPPSFQNKYNFPTKLGDYLLSERPVIIAANGTEINKYMFDGKNSSVVKPNDVDAMANRIVKYCLNPREAKDIGKAGRQTAERYFDYRQNAESIKEFLSSL